MASLTTLKINSYINIMLMVLIFAIFMLIVGTAIQYFWLSGTVTLTFQIGFVIVVTVIAVIIQVMISSSVVMWSTGTKILKKGENKFLEETVASLAKKADVPMPKLGIVEDDTPNAFVFGLTQSGTTLSVHTGLLERLNKNEIKAVIAHELGHVKNRDCMYMTFLSVIPLISYMGMHLLFMMRYGGGRGGGKGGGGAMIAILIIGLASLVVYGITSLLIKRLSRIREFYADAYSGYITNDPHALASALTKITYGLSLAPPEKKSKNAARQFYIGDVQNAQMEMAVIQRKADKYDLDGDGVIDENELELAMQDEAQLSAWNNWGNLLSTHPPTFKRILALKEMEKELKKGQIRADNVYEKVEF